MCYPNWYVAGYCMSNKAKRCVVRDKQINFSCRGSVPTITHSRQPWKRLRGVAVSCSVARGNSSLGLNFQLSTFFFKISLRQSFTCLILIIWPLERFSIPYPIDSSTLKLVCFGMFWYVLVCFGMFWYLDWGGGRVGGEQRLNKKYVGEYNTSHPPFEIDLWPWILL